MYLAPMKAVTFDVSAARYLLAKGLGGVTTSVTFGALSGVRLVEAPEPVLPGDDWVKLDVILAGICGTDIGNLTYAASPAMEPFGSFPAVLGHEILARVREAGPAVTSVSPGDRVVVDPMLSCQVRGFGHDPCASCASGYPSTCERGGEEGALRIAGHGLSRGLTIGYHRDLPGAWGERLVAHECQLFPVPEALDDRVAVLAEPLAIGVHALLQAPPGHADTVLVIGSGPIAMGTLWALRATGFEGEVVAQAKRSRETELATALGASRVVRPGLEAREALRDTGAMAYQPIVGSEVYAGGGFPVIYDCVGTGESLEQALSFASPRGQVVMLGCAARLRSLDLTFLWARELQVRGFIGYGREYWRGEARHTIAVTLDLLGERAGAADQLLTHIFPLDQYREALGAAADRGHSGAMKVALRP
jgi:threonine dehydrogenase-like Zn-dependent dehydrogenase